MEIKEILARYKKAGLSPIPILNSILKSPIISEWNPFRERIATDEEIAAWIEQTKYFAIVAGKISGNLEILDFDEKHRTGVLKQWSALLSTEVKQEAKTLPMQRTINGGYHLFYRCSEIKGNSKLARIKKGDDIKTIIETRGEGGYALVPPSLGYTVMRGDLFSIPFISPEIREELWSAARQLDEMPEEKNIPPPHYSTPAGNGKTPWEEFTARVDWSEILVGWKKIKTDAKGKTFWRRPDKEYGISGTTNYAGLDLFHNFSTNAPPFSEKSYNKFTVYALLNHEGNARQAASTLYKKGFGKRYEEKNNGQTFAHQNNEEGEAYETEAPSLMIRRMSDIPFEPVEWLWNKKIARGKITLIAGHPGLGKSQIGLWLMAQTSTGAPFLNDATERSPANCIILSAEDDTDTIRPRLIAQNADNEKITIIDAVTEKINGGNTIRAVNLAKDIERIGEAFRKLEHVSLLLVDPISSYLGDTDSHKNAEVRAFLAELGRCASQYKVAVVLIDHLNKSQTSDAQMRFMGSLGFAAAARASYLVTKDNQDDEKRLFLPVKNNLAKDTGGFSYRTEEVEVLSTSGKIIKTSKIVWNAEEIMMSANEALANERSRGGKINIVEEAEEWLFNQLTHKPNGVDGQEIKRNADRAGISERTLYRAASNMEIDREGAGFGKSRTWKLKISTGQEHDTILVPDNW